MKECSCCHRSLPFADFNRQAASRDGHQSRCRECANRARREYRIENASRLAEYGALWRAANPGKAKELTLAWRARNADRVAEVRRTYAAATRDQRLERTRRDRQANPEKYRKALAEWKAANPEKVREYQRRRRAAGYGGALARVDPDALWDSCRGVCGICDRPLDRTLPWPDPMSCSLDHIVPLSAGGGHEQDNVRWTHLLCNLRKGNRAA